MDLSKFKSIFISEVEDQLQTLNKGMILIEKLDGKKATKKTEIKNTYNDMMRASHTIKGSSASMGYVKMAFLTHVMEDVFDAARNDLLVLNKALFNQLFQAIDNIEKSLNNVKENDTDLDFDDFSAKLKTLTGVATEGVGKSTKKENATPVLSEILPMPKTEEQVSETKKVVANNEEADIDTLKQGNDIEESAVAKVDYIKVPVKRLDALLDMVEELLISKMRIEEMSQDNAELKEVFSHMDLLISGIQFEVTQSRLVPVEQAFARFPRMIRDLAQMENKKINFEVSGGEIELDRSVVDKLGEPLIHLLRNAVDHGIDKEGEILLTAIRKSERVQFIVENKGICIDVEKVKQVALKKGLVDAKTLSTMNDQEVIEFLFNANFSTNDVVTEISGRGVGLSVVKKFAEAFNGRVIIENYEHGAKFILELPQTLAIIETLLVTVGKSIFAIPFTDIERSISIHISDIKRMGDRDMGVIDNQNIPLIDLGKSFNFICEEKNESEYRLVVLVKKEEGMAGIVVDTLVNEQEVIVKPFSSILQGIKEFSGSTILGDGQVVLILDVLNIIKILNKNN